MRIVLDTNVLISAAINPLGVPSQLTDCWFAGAFDVLVSQPTRSELHRVINYQKLQRYILADAKERVLHAIDQLAVVVTNLPTVTASADPDDNWILATAIAGNADLIVSGDTRHMLPIGAIGGIPIVSPTDALARLQPR